MDFSRVMVAVVEFKDCQQMTLADATIVSQRGKNLRTSDNQQLGRWIRDYLGQQSGVMVDTRPSVLGRKSYFRVYKLASDYFYFDL